MYNSFNPYQLASSIVRVNGIDGAKAYKMAPNSTAALFDGNEDIFYIKTTDGAGFPTIRVFKFSELKERGKQMESYISREEFEAFKREVLNHGKQHIQEPGRRIEKQDGAGNAVPELYEQDSGAGSERYL